MLAAPCSERSKLVVQNVHSSAEVAGNREFGGRLCGFGRQLCRHAADGGRRQRQENAASTTEQLEEWLRLAGGPSLDTLAQKTKSSLRAKL